VFSISVMPTGLQLLLGHVRLLLQLLLSAGPFQRFAGNVLWRMSQLPQGAQAMIQRGVPMLLEVIQRGSEDVQVAGAVISGVLASSEEGLRAFAAHVPQLLAAAQ
jgi:hypothetical protein